MNIIKRLFISMGFTILLLGLIVLISAPGQASQMVQSLIMTKEEYETKQTENDLTTEKEIFELTNLERVKHGLPELTFNLHNAQVARYWSMYMYNTATFEHSDKYCHGENIYVLSGSPLKLDAKNVVKAWMDSYGHRQNILDKEFKSLGVGVYKGYVTQNFC